MVFRDGGGKEGPGQRLETSGEEVDLRAILPVVLSEPLLGTCVHVESKQLLPLSLKWQGAVSRVQRLLRDVPLASLDFRANIIYLLGSLCLKLWVTVCLHVGVHTNTYEGQERVSDPRGTGAVGGPESPDTEWSWQ